MARRIQVLSEEVVNRIAAGEVVERPASVLKELLENAIDAGGNEISIIVKKGGLEEIRVIDNGTGMGEEDAITAFQRYATSKIRMSDDLATIQTLGFRGEALPSIASVSRVRMVTREEDALGGAEILLEAGQVKEIREAGSARGTDFTVRDLFFNTPARRKFMRSVSTEFSHIIEAVVRVGLAHPGIHFRLFHNEKKVLDTPSTKDRIVRIASLLGGDVSKVLRLLRARVDSLELEGYLSAPVFTRPNSKGIYTYVNGRFIRDRVVHHALMEGYRSLIPKDRYPVAVIFLCLPPWFVDVNVHPTKTEVRFNSTDLIHRGVVGLCQDLVSGSAEGMHKEPVNSTAARPPSEATHEPAVSYGAQPTITFSRGWTGSEFGREALLEGISSTPRMLGQIGRTYLVCESPRGLLLIDQHAAHERIVFERLRRETEDGTLALQRLLLPETVELSPAEWETAQRYLPELKRIGFDLEPFGRNTMVVKSVPSILSREQVSQTVSDLIRDLMVEEAQGEAGKNMDRALKVAACHGAIRAGQELSPEEMRALVQEMEAVGFLTTCPHGRPACVEISLDQLEKMFMR